MNTRALIGIGAWLSIACGGGDHQSGTSAAHEDGGPRDASGDGGARSHAGSGNAAGAGSGGHAGNGGSAGTPGAGGASQGGTRATEDAGDATGATGPIDAGSGGEAPDSGTDSGSTTDAGIVGDAGSISVTLPDWSCAPSSAACAYPSLRQATIGNETSARYAFTRLSSVDETLRAALQAVALDVADIRAGRAPACLRGHFVSVGGKITLDTRACADGPRGVVSVTPESAGQHVVLDVVAGRLGHSYRVRGEGIYQDVVSVLLGPPGQPSAPGYEFKSVPGGAGLVVTDPDDATFGGRFTDFTFQLATTYVYGPLPAHTRYTFLIPAVEYDYTDAVGCVPLHARAAFDANMNFVVSFTSAGSSTSYSIALNPVPGGTQPSPYGGAPDPACPSCSDGSGASCSDAGVCKNGDGRRGTTPCGTAGTLDQICVSGVWKDSTFCVEDCGDLTQPGAATTGSVTIASDADLGKLAGVSLVAGDLTFQDYVPGVAAWADSVRCVRGTVFLQGGSYPDFSGLRNLRSIGGGLGLETTVLSGDLRGLDSLRFIDGGIGISGASIVSLSGAPLLSHASALVLTDSTVTSLSPFAGVAGIEALSITTSMVTSVPTTLGFLPQLHYVSFDRDPNLSDLSGLARVKHICFDLYDCPGVVSLPLSELTSADCLIVQGASSLESITAPNLASVSGVLDLTDAPVLQALDLGNASGAFERFAVEAVGLEDFSGLSLAHFTVKNQWSWIRGCPNLKTLAGLGGLTEVGDFSIASNPSLTSLDGLSGLRTLTSNLYVTDDAALTDVSALSGVDTFGTSVEFGDCPALPTCKVNALVASWPLPTYTEVNVHGTDDSATCP